MSFDNSAVSSNHYEEDNKNNYITFCINLINNSTNITNNDYIIKMLEEKGVNFKNSTGRTFASMAAQSGNMLVLYILYSKGANMSIPDMYGKTPVYFAASYGKLEALQFLVWTCSCDVNTTSSDDSLKTPLDAAMYYNHINIIDFINFIIVNTKI